jgi:hypothetical protein
VGVERQYCAAVDEDDLYDAMDWLLARQPAIEKVLAQRRLSRPLEA